MVWVRLSIKVYPRDPNVEVTRESLPSLLLVVKNPWQTKMTDLMAMIETEWNASRNSAEPLHIKELVDDAHPALHLCPHKTVADVWISRETVHQGYYSRGTVRVLQHPEPHSSISQSRTFRVPTRLPIRRTIRRQPRTRRIRSVTKEEIQELKMRVRFAEDRGQEVIGYMLTKILQRKKTIFNWQKRNIRGKKAEDASKQLVTLERDLADIEAVISRLANA